MKPVLPGISVWEAERLLGEDGAQRHADLLDAGRRSIVEKTADDLEGVFVGLRHAARGVDMIANRGARVVEPAGCICRWVHPSCIGRCGALREVDVRPDAITTFRMPCTHVVTLAACRHETAADAMGLIENMKTLDARVRTIATSRTARHRWLQVLLVPEVAGGCPTCST